MAGKNLPSAGEGGVMTTNSREVRNRAASIKCFGEQISADGERSVVHETFGWNYRINILSAIMASHQLFRLDSYNAKRIESAARLNAVIGEMPGFRAPLVREGSGHVYHMYRFSFDPESAGIKATIDQVREALQRVFLAEGLPLVEFQNMPLPGHALLQRKVGFGGGAPWSCHGRSADVYDIDRYPGSLHAIRNSLVVGYPAQAPLTNPDVVSAYVRGFSKLHDNFDAFGRFARSLDAAPPWRAAARLF
jgi:perosamine synthetase